MPASPERESEPGRHAQGSPRYLACVYCPPAQRELLQTLFALEREIAEATRSGLDHAVAHVRLQWWHEESLRAAQGAALHPLARAAHAQLTACGVSGLDLSGLVEMTRWDLAGMPFPTRNELNAYCTHWACAITVPVARCALPAEQPLALCFGKRLGAALRELELLENLTLEADEIDPEAFERRPWPRELVERLQMRHLTLRAELGECVAGLDAPLQAPLRGLLVWAVLARRRSVRESEALERPGAASRVSRLGDAWQGWRAARRAEAGRLVLKPGSSH